MQGRRRQTVAVAWFGIALLALGMEVTGLAYVAAVIGVANVGEPIFASPAFVDGQIFIRGGQHLFCIAK